MDKICLYTRQHENSYYELQNKGVITNKKLYVRLHMMDIADFFLEKYDIFVVLAEKIVPRPAGTDYPIWCSVSKNNCLKPIAKELVYCLEVPKEEVIYFDGGKWDYILNNLYIAKDEKDAKLYAEQLKNLGIADEYSIMVGKYAGLFPEIEQKIVASWQRIFNIDQWNEFNVQANLWHIKKEWVKHIVKPNEDFFAITSDMQETFPPR